MKASSIKPAQTLSGAHPKLIVVVHKQTVDRGIWQSFASREVLEVLAIERVKTFARANPEFSLWIEAKGPDGFSRQPSTRHS
jgi:hypothetical protein